MVINQAIFPVGFHTAVMTDLNPFDNDGLVKIWGSLKSDRSLAPALFKSYCQTGNYFPKSDK